MFDNYVEDITDEIKVLNDNVLDLKDYLIENNNNNLNQDEIEIDNNLLDEIEIEENLIDIEQSIKQLSDVEIIDNTDLLEEILIEEQKQTQYAVDQFNYIHDVSIILIVILIAGFGLISLFREWSKW